MKRASFDHGFSEQDWEAAKAEARNAMVGVAARREVICYSDLVNEIETFGLEPQSAQLAHMLGEISTEEAQAGRGMLTVVVVHKFGDLMPGPGFFELARSLGYETADRDTFWIGELARVHKTWSCPERAIGRRRTPSCGGRGHYAVCEYRRGARSRGSSD